MNITYLNSVVPKKSIEIPVNYLNQINEMLLTIDSKVKKDNILKLTIYFTTRDCYDEIYNTIQKWKPSGLEIEYIGNYMNYNPLIQMMASVIAKVSPSISYNYQIVNYII